MITTLKVQLFLTHHDYAIADTGYAYHVEILRTYRCGRRPSVIRDFVPGGDEDPGGREASESHKRPSHVVCCPIQNGSVCRLPIYFDISIDINHNFGVVQRIL